MALSDEDRLALWARFMRDVSLREEVFGQLSKHEIRDAVDAIDQWIDDNISSFNAAIPLPARNELTAKQKAEILCIITTRRWETS